MERSDFILQRCFRFVSRLIFNMAKLKPFIKFFYLKIMNNIFNTSIFMLARYWLTIL